MKIKGTHTLDSDIKTVWKLLVDPDVLASITPGVKKLDRIEGDQFIAVSDVKIGPVRGTFEGELSLLDMVENEGMTVHLDQKSKMGNAVASIDLKLNILEASRTEVIYTGDAKLSGRLASMGQRLVGGVVNTLSKEFFVELEREILKDKGAETPSRPKFSWLQRIIEFFKYIFKSN